MPRSSDHTRDELRALILDAATIRVSDQGLGAVTARNIAADIGYTPGTIYNLFDDLDDLVWHMNGQTLDALFQDLTQDSAQRSARAALQLLAKQFLKFVRENPRRWAAVLEFSAQTSTTPPDWYAQKTLKLLDLADLPLAEILPDSDPVMRSQHVQVLWSALYGISALNSDPDTPSDDASSLVDLLIETYVAGLGASIGRKDR
jgi:AcrR family transcriptional regulator